MSPSPDFGHIKANKLFHKKRIKAWPPPDFQTFQRLCISNGKSEEKCGFNERLSKFYPRCTLIYIYKDFTAIYFYNIHSFRNLLFSDFFGSFYCMALILFYWIWGKHKFILKNLIGQKHFSRPIHIECSKQFK